MSNYPDDSSTVKSEPEQVRPYVKPAISHELKLETRAGSPLGLLPGPDDPLGTDPGANPR